MIGLQGKKSSLLDFVIVLIFIMGAIAILGQKDTIIYSAGPKELLALHAYSEGEEYREYLQTAAKFSFLQAAGMSGAKTQEDCIVKMGSQKFQNDFNSIFKNYVVAYRAGEQHLGVKAITGGGFKNARIERTGSGAAAVSVESGQQFGGKISAPINSRFDIEYFIDPSVATEVNCNAFAQYNLNRLTK